MRATQFIKTELAENSLQEIDRRGFLKGVGAAAVTGAAGGAMAAPFRHGKTVDPMTDKAEGRNSTVASDDGTARLYIQWNDGVWFDSTQGLLGFTSVSGGFPLQSMRIKIGNSPVENTVGTLGKNFKSMQIGGPDDTKQLAGRILKHSGELRIEVLLASGNKKVFKFTIEPDSTTRDFTAKQKQQDIQQRQQAEKDKVAQEKQKQDDEKRASEKEEQRLKNLEIERKRQEEEMRPELERQAKIRKIESELYQYNKQISANILNNFQQMLGNKLKNISHIQRTNTTVQVDKDGNIIKINVEPNPDADKLFGWGGVSSYDRVRMGKDAYDLLKNPKFYNGLFTNIPPDLFQAAMDENGLMTINLMLGDAGYNNPNKLGGKISIPKLRDLGVRSNFDINESNNQGVAEGGEGSGRHTPGAWDTTPGKVGRVEKTAQGIRHHADSSRYGGTEPDVDVDRLDKGAVNTMDKALDVKWDRESKKYFSPIKVDEVNNEKIGGRYDADDFDDMVSRLKKLAGSGPMKTVYDPDRRVYRNMPTAQQPAQQPKKAPR